MMRVRRAGRKPSPSKADAGSRETADIDRLL
jgi:hypothetical protein